MLLVYGVTHLFAQLRQEVFLGEGLVFEILTDMLLAVLDELDIILFGQIIFDTLLYQSCNTYSIH